MGRHVNYNDGPASVRAAAFAIVSPHLVDARVNGVHDVAKAVHIDSGAIEAVRHRRKDGRDYHDTNQHEGNTATGVANNDAGLEHFEGSAGQVRAAGDNDHMFDRQHVDGGLRGEIENKRQRRGSCPANPGLELASRSGKGDGMESLGNMSGGQKVREATVVLVDRGQAEYF